MFSSDCLTGKTALITGAAKRLGRAMAVAMGEAGADIAIHYRSSAGQAEALRSEVEAMGRRAVCVRADLASEEEARGLLDTAVAALGPVDVLVNNASVFTESRLADFDPGELCLNMDVHAVAPLMLSRAFAAQGRPGCILNMLDSRITDYDERHAAYHLSKRALFTLTRMSALEFAPLVRVNGIAPGLILPPEGKDEGYLEELAHTNPLNSYGGEDDIACAALYLLASRFVTGQVLYVDGGRHLKGNTYGA